MPQHPTSSCPVPGPRRSAVGRPVVLAALVALLTVLGGLPATAATPPSAALPSAPLSAAAVQPAPTTVSGWAGSRTVTTGFAPSRSITLSPAQGRPVKVQQRTATSWTTIATVTAPAGDSAKMSVTVPAVKSEKTVRYRLAIAPTATAGRLITGEWAVTYAKRPTPLSGWSKATTSVVYGKTKSRTITAPAGRAVTLQRLSGGSWRNVRGSVVPISGKLKVTTPAVATTGSVAYRVTIAATTRYAGAVSPTWTIKAVAPPMPAQRYNGEVRGAVGAWGGYSNGRIPTSALCSPSWTSSTHKTRCDADAALEELNKAYKARFGTSLSVTSTYRTYAQQVSLKKQKPTLAATPGTSNHGWGVAVDLGGGVNTWGSAQHSWMRANANRYGWFHPSWAQFTGSLPEPWHWEYAGAVASGKASQSRALGMQLARTQRWNTQTQRQCLADLWDITSDWSHTKSTASGARRGIPQASMSAAFGSSWSRSAAAKEYLANPKTQIMWGLADLTKRHGTACKALSATRKADAATPVVKATVSGPRTIAPGRSSAVQVTYTKKGTPVRSATMTLQKLKAGEWRDAVNVRLTDGVATRKLAPGSTTTTYRFRNHNSSAVSAAFTITVKR